MLQVRHSRLGLAPWAGLKLPVDRDFGRVRSNPDPLVTARKPACGIWWTQDHGIYVPLPSSYFFLFAGMSFRITYLSSQLQVRQVPTTERWFGSPPAPPKSRIDPGSRVWLDMFHGSIAC
jgi:hypothetical protein